MRLHQRVCANCGIQFQTRDGRPGKGRCCSLSCAAALASRNRRQDGAFNNNWKGGNTERKRRYRMANPQKHAVHLATRNAIRKGILVQAPCAVCGATPTEAHHEDYERPLEITWLCKKHHLESHGGRFAGCAKMGSSGVEGTRSVNDQRGVMESVTRGEPCARPLEARIAGAEPGLLPNKEERCKTRSC